MRLHLPVLLGASLLLAGGATELRAQTVLEPPIEECGDPVRPVPLAPATGRIAEITASDALHALRTAVGTKECALCLCDTDDSRVITASDALRILKKAVGLEVELNCVLCGIPDGYILFSSRRTGNDQIWVVKTDGTGLEMLSTSAGAPGVNDEQANWSPDGQKIVFSSNRTGDYEVFVMDADGGNQTNLSNDPNDYNGQGCFSADGTKIAYLDSDGSATSEIFTMDADGDNQSKLFPGPGYVDGDPEWSPDGTRIAFESNRVVLNMQNQYDVFVMDADGQNQVNLTPGSPTTDQDAAWSPDSSTIVFNSARDGDDEIFRIGADGSNLVQLTHNDSSDVHASFSPDGQFISFASKRDPANDFDIYIMHSTGGRAWRLTSHPARDFWTAWKPAP